MSDVDEILERTPTELEHNRALEKGITFHEQLDKLTTTATKRFNDTLTFLEHYNEVVGPRLRQAAQELFAPNCGQSTENPRPQTEATSIVAADLAPFPDGDGAFDPKPDQPSPPIGSDQSLNQAADQALAPTDQAAGVELAPSAAPTSPSTEANQVPV